MPAVSVIIPVYNVEDYLRECLDSVVGQSLEDIEIICINDGSTDSSPDILKEYADKDSRISIIVQENAGLSAARNSGLKNAKGKYVYFIDSDDYIEGDALEMLYSVSEEKSLDCVIFKLLNFYDETGEKFQTNYYDMEFLQQSVENNIFSHRDVADDIFHIAVSIPGKFFRRDLISDMEFEEGIIFEDNPFFVEVLFKAERMLFLDEYLYYRRIRQNSIITSNRNFSDYIIVSNMLADITKKYGFYDDYKAQLYDKTLTNIFLRFTQVGDDYKEDYFLKMKEDFTAKKDEYDNDETFQCVDARLREIFYKCLEADTYKEFKLHVDLFDTQSKLDDITEQKRQLNREKQRLLHRTHDLSKKANELANENRRLKE